MYGRALQFRPLSALVSAVGLAVLLALVSATEAVASGVLVPTAPGPPTERGWVLSSQHVSAVVRGTTALVTVEQELENRLPRTLEADYVFAFPAGAHVQSPALIVGGEGVDGTLLRAHSAHAHLVGILERRKDIALLELLGHDLFVAAGLSIAPGEHYGIVFKYEQQVEPVGGNVALSIPLRTATISADPASRVSIEIDVDLRTGGDSRQGVESRADAGYRLEIGPVYSPTHDMTVERAHARHVRMTYEGPIHPREPDLRVFWTTTRSSVGATLLTYWPESEEQGYFLLVAQPSRFEGSRLATRPKDVVFVVDTSESMSGDRLEQIRAALFEILDQLEPADRVNIVAFSDAARPLFPRPRDVDAATLRQARTFLRDLVGSGACNVDAALAAALAAPRDAGRATSILYVTDGRPTRGDTSRTGILEHVRAANGEPGARIFGLGLGVDVDTVLLDRLALENGGMPFYVRPHADAAAALVGLFSGIREPVLARVALELRGIEASAVLPTDVPDLGRGGSIFVTGRYARPGRPEIVLGESQGPVRQEYGSLLWAGARGDVSVGRSPARIWALQRIAAHVDAIRLGTEDAPDRVQELVELSQRFGVLTEYTAFMADEDADHTALDAGVALAQKTLVDYRSHSRGALGLAQALNQADRRARRRAPTRSQGGWLPKEGGRDVTYVTWPGVSEAGDRTYFYRRRLGWVDASVVDITRFDLQIERWSPAFVELLKHWTPEQGAGMAQAGPVVMRMGPTVVRFVDGS